MKSLTCFFILAFFLLTPVATARDRPQDYGSPDSFLSGYFTGISNTEQIKKGLNVVRALHPAWEANYQEGIWDCSEMAEYLKFFFAKCGIDTTYCQSQGLWHCWLEVQDGPWYYSQDVNYDRHMIQTETDWWETYPFKSGR